MGARVEKQLKGKGKTQLPKANTHPPGGTAERAFAYTLSLILDVGP